MERMRLLGVSRVSGEESGGTGYSLLRCANHLQTVSSRLSKYFFILFSSILAKSFTWLRSLGDPWFSRPNF